MTFSLRFSIKSRLFPNSPSLMLEVKELILSVRNLVSRGIIVSAPLVIKKGVSPVDL